MSKASFDTYARRYDEHFTWSPVGKAQRERVHYFFKREVKDKKNILEINCGTGEDAIWMAGNGHTVLATDISEEMIRVAEQKKKASNSKVQFLRSAISELAKLEGTKFDLVFSNFGGLNCLSEDELLAAAPVLASLLNDKGILVFVVMSRKCQWEKVYFRYKKQTDKAHRRKTKEGVSVSLGTEQFSTWYYSPKEICAIFEKHFRIVKTRPVGLFIPPSYMGDFFAKRKFALRTLQVFEKLSADFSMLSDHADHYFIVLKKRAA